MLAESAERVRSQELFCPLGTESALVTDTDDVSEAVDDLHERAAALQDDRGALGALFTREFMRRHTNAVSFRAFLDESGWAVATRSDFAAIPEAAFDEYVASETAFADWESMLGRASEEWMARQLVD